MIAYASENSNTATRQLGTAGETSGKRHVVDQEYLYSESVLKCKPLSQERIRQLCRLQHTGHCAEVKAATYMASDTATVECWKHSTCTTSSRNTRVKLQPVCNE